MEDSRNTIKVRRGNCSLHIPEIDKQRYLDMGYNVISESGTVVERATANDVPTLLAKCAELEAENNTLRSQLENAKKKLSEQTKATKKTTTKKKKD